MTNELNNVEKCRMSRLQNEKLRKRVSWWLLTIGVLIVAVNGAYLTYERDRRFEVQRAADAAALRAELIVVSAPVAIIMCDSQSKISLANPAAEAFFGYQPGELTGKAVGVLIPHDLRAKHNLSFLSSVKRLQNVKDNWLYQRTNLPTEGLTKDGRRIPLLLSIRMIKYDGKIEFVSSMRPPSNDATVSSAPLPTLPSEALIQQKR